MKEVKSGVFLILLISVAAPAGEPRVPGDMYDISAPIIDQDQRGWDVQTYLDNIESLTLGPVDGQVNEWGETWSSYDGTVQSLGDNKFVSQTNTFADNYFFAEVGTTLPPPQLPPTPSAFRFSVDSWLSDLRTSRFYTPMDNSIGQIFTRVGDADNDGKWEVLQLDAAGHAYFADTGVSIPQSSFFNLMVQVVGPDLEVFVNGGRIFTGDVIDTRAFGGRGLSSTLTGAYFESANNDIGYGSEARYDNVRIVIPEPATLVFVLVGAVMATGRVAGKRLA